jgi:hypothetical protein
VTAGVDTLAFLPPDEDSSLIKKKTKFSSYIRKFRWDGIGCKVIYEEGHPSTVYVLGNAQIIFNIYEEIVSHI